MTEKRAGGGSADADAENWSEVFLAVVVYYGRERIQHALKVGNSVGKSYRQAPSLNVNEGLFTPAQSLLAAFVDAGRSYSGDIEKPIRRMALEAEAKAQGRADEVPSTVSNRVKKIEDELVGPALRGNIAFQPDWLGDLALGLCFPMGGEAWIKLNLCSGRQSLSGKPVLDGLKAELANLRAEPMSPGAAIADALQDMTYELGRLPDHYPEHVTLEGLASALSLGELDPDSHTRDRENPDLLYAAGPRTLRNIAGLDATFAAHHRCVVLGDPGSGKSTALAAAVLGSIESGKPALFVRLDVLATMNGDSWKDLDHALQAVVEAGLGSGNVSVSSQMRDSLIESLRSDHNFLLALDGLDEISQSYERNRVEWVMDKIAAETRTRIILSSRYTGYLRPRFMDACQELGMAPIQSPENFVEIWFGNDLSIGYDRAITALESNGLQDLAKIPVILGFICFVAEKGHVKTTKSGLYEQYIRLYIEQPWKTQTRSEDQVDQIETEVTRVAWAMAKVPAQRLPVFPEEAHVDLPAWKEQATRQELTRLISGSRHSLDLALQSGLLVPQNTQRVRGELDQYRWIHRTIHEHLAGRFLSEKLEKESDNGYALVREYAMRPAWKVPLEHAGSSVSSASFGAMLRALSDVYAHAPLAELREIIQQLVPSQALDEKLIDTSIEVLAATSNWPLDYGISVESLTRYLTERDDEHIRLVLCTFKARTYPYKYPKEILQLISKFRRLLTKEQKYDLELSWYNHLVETDQLLANRDFAYKVLTDPYPYLLNFLHGDLDTHACTMLLARALYVVKEHEGRLSVASSYLGGYKYFRKIISLIKPWAEQDPARLSSFFQSNEAGEVFESLVRFHLDPSESKHIAVLLGDDRVPAAFAVQIAANVNKLALEPRSKLAPWAAIGAIQRRDIRMEPGGMSLQQCESRLIDLITADASTPAPQQVREWVQAKLWARQHMKEVAPDLLWSADAVVAYGPLDGIILGKFVQSVALAASDDAEDLCKIISLLPAISPMHLRKRVAFNVYLEVREFVAFHGALEDAATVLNAYLSAFRDGTVSASFGYLAIRGSFAREKAALQRARLIIQGIRETNGSLWRAAPLLYDLDILPAYWGYFVEWDNQVKEAMRLMKETSIDLDVKD